MNHFANGSFHSSTFFQGLNQTSSSLACRAQNFSGERIDSLYNLRYCARDVIRACLEKSFAGRKTRFSVRTEVMLEGLSFAGIQDRKSTRLNSSHGYIS